MRLFRSHDSMFFKARINEVVSRLETLRTVHSGLTVRRRDDTGQRLLHLRQELAERTHLTATFVRALDEQRG